MANRMNHEKIRRNGYSPDPMRKQINSKLRFNDRATRNQMEFAKFLYVELHDKRGLMLSPVFDDFDVGEVNRYITKAKRIQRDNGITLPKFVPSIPRDQIEKIKNDPTWTIKKAKKQGGEGR